MRKRILLKMGAIGAHLPYGAALSGSPSVHSHVKT